MKPGLYSILIFAAFLTAGLPLIYRNHIGAERALNAASAIVAITLGLIFIVDSARAVITRLRAEVSGWKAWVRIVLSVLGALFFILIGTHFLIGALRI